MKKKSILLFLGCLTSMFVFIQCAEQPKEEQPAQVIAEKPSFGGYETQEQWGEHLVTIAACNDCHTPKKMGPGGPELDSSLLLSGHPSQLAPFEVNRKDMESKGLVVTNDLTTWVGPWGISYTANLTSDATGIGGWQESNFITAIREGKYKGISSARSLLPPMPWQMYRNMTDDELKAIFAFLKSTKPIANVVPDPVPPVSAAPH